MNPTKREPGDPRDEVITISLTAEEWDSLGFAIPYPEDPDALTDARLRRYADRLEHSTRDKIACATPGAAERRALAVAEVEASLPRLDRKAKRALRNKMFLLYAKLVAGTLKVDHLGHGGDNELLDVGFDVELIPHTFEDGPAFHFHMREVWFEHKPWPLTDQQRAWFTRTVKLLTGRCEPWGGGPWISARFGK